MDDAQRAAFARDGYIVIPNVISPPLIQQLNAEIDARIRHEHGGSIAGERIVYRQGALQPCHGARAGEDFELLPGWEEENGAGISTAAFRELIEPPTLGPILTEILGDPAWKHVPEQVPPEKRGRWRLDHDNLHLCDKHHPGGGVHGGPGNHHVTAVCATLLPTPKPQAGPSPPHPD